MGPRVVSWIGIPAPYIEERFNAVARRGNLDFEAWFSARSKASPSWLIDVSLLLVGDGVDEDHYHRLCSERGLRNTAFTGFVQKERLPELYAAAHAFVFPTLGDPWGLVVPPADSAALLNPMRLVAQDRDLRARMSRASARKIAGHTLERWAKDFEDGVERVLAASRASSP